MSPTAPTTSLGVVPSRSQIQNWDSAHLDRAATRWRASADQSESLFAQHRQNVAAPGGTEWTGRAKDAALDRVTADLAVVGRQTDTLREAAGIASNGAGDVRAAQRKALEAIAEAEADGFRVGEDLAVRDSRRLDLATAAARHAAAREHAENIRWNAEQLLATDALVGKHLAAKASDLQGITFDESGDGSIQMLDNEIPGIGQDPPPPLLPPPLAPAPNDDPWKHGGDRRWTSVATEGMKQKMVALAELEMERNNQHTAARMLEHYLGNSGEPVALPSTAVDSWLSNSVNGYGDGFPSPATQINSNLQSVTHNALAEAQRTGRPVTMSGNTPWAVVAGNDGDSVRALGHYSVSTAYSITMNPDGTYTSTYRNDLTDWYNFATTSPMPTDFAHNASNAAHDLQAVGIAQDFLVTGSGGIQMVQGKVS